MENNYVPDKMAKPLNNILRLCFDLNARSDSIAYALSFQYYDHMSSIFHHSWAHYWPQVADVISDEMLRYKICPVRLGLNSYEYETMPMAELFAENQKGIEELYAAVEDSIGEAEFVESKGLQLFLEDLLLKLRPYVKQSFQWCEGYKQFNGNNAQFNIHFHEYTTNIPVVE